MGDVSSVFFKYIQYPFFFIVFCLYPADMALRWLDGTVKSQIYSSYQRIVSKQYGTFHPVFKFTYIA